MDIKDVLKNSPSVCNVSKYKKNRQLKNSRARKSQPTITQDKEPVAPPNKKTSLLFNVDVGQKILLLDDDDFLEPEITEFTISFLWRKKPLTNNLKLEEVSSGDVLRKIVKLEAKDQ